MEKRKNTQKNKQITTKKTNKTHTNKPKTKHHRVHQNTGWGGLKHFAKDDACTTLVIGQVQEQPWQQESWNKFCLEGTSAGHIWSMKQKVLQCRSNGYQSCRTPPETTSYPSSDLNNGLAHPELGSWTWQRLLRLIHF